MRIIDLTGKRCPMPLIETKKALNTLSKDEVFKIILDSGTAVKNVTLYLRDNGISVDQHLKGKNYELIITKNKAL